MGLFGENISKEEKQAQEIAKFVNKYHLDDLAPEDLDTVRQIATDLAGNGLINFCVGLSGKAEDVAKLTYLSALVRQNWLIINQLSRISKQLEK